MEQIEIKVLSIPEIKGVIKMRVICTVIALSLFIAALLAMRADGVMGEICMIFILPILGVLGFAYLSVYNIIESMWIIKSLRRGSNPYSKSQVHLRLGIQNSAHACLSLTGTILLVVWLFKLLPTTEFSFYTPILVLIPCMIVFIYGKAALQMFRDAGRFEERERLEREGG